MIKGGDATVWINGSPLDLGISFSIDAPKDTDDGIRILGEDHFEVSFSCIYKEDDGFSDAVTRALPMRDFLVKPINKWWAPGFLYHDVQFWTGEIALMDECGSLSFEVPTCENVEKVWDHWAAPPIFWMWRKIWNPISWWVRKVIQRS